MGVRIDRVQVEHHREAMGIGEPEPRISWRFCCDDDDVADWTQESYEIEVTRPDAPSAPPERYAVRSSESVLVPWPSRPLPSRSRATVRVRATGRAPHDRQPTPWSDPVAVETGLLQRRDWACSLISSALPADPALPRRPVLFRRAFALRPDQRCTRARLYVTAHGVYDAHVNGCRVGDHVLAPGWTSYKHRLAYQTFDVTAHLRPGPNVLAAQVAEGWFCGRLGFLGGARNIWGDTLALVALLVADLADGTTLVVGSDARWTSGHGSLLASEIYDGETCDLAQEPAGWQRPGFDDAAWAGVRTHDLPAAELVAPDGPPVRAIETVPASAVRTTPRGRIVVDFAQNLVGWVRLRLKRPRGPTTVTLRFAEELEDGEIATRPLRHCKATDTLVLAGRDEDDDEAGDDEDHLVWEPKFTFHGFRYVQVDGLCARASELDLGCLTAVVVHTDMEPTGWFECSHPLLNQLHKNIRWGMRGNFLSVPTDCPQRDERLGWTGDIHVFAPTASFLYDVSGMLRGWLRDLAAEQLRDHGSVPPFFCPDVLVGREPRQPTALWGDVVVGLPWTLYTAYADRDILARQLESMQTWLREGIPRDPATGLWDDASFQFGDWLDPLAPPDDPGNAVTDPQLVANAYLVHTTAVARDVCLALGRPDLAASHAAALARLRPAFQRRFVSPEGRVVGDSQTALALALHFGLLEGLDQQRAAARRLRHLVLRGSRFKIATGFAGTPVVGHALALVGEAQLFYRMLYHRKAPSWLYQVCMGATTVWERWDSKLPDGRVNPGEMTSFNHYALGSVADWMHRHIAGLAPLAPGWRRFLVAPVPGGDLSRAAARFLGPYGRISVEWRLVAGEEGGAQEEQQLLQQLHLTVTVPPNSVAEVRLPRAVDRHDEGVVVGSGTHHFQTAYERPPWPPLPIYPQYHPHDDDEP